ncbi:Protein of unknown function [Thermobacillus xylanilyticus]|uniref:Uncharacterized protein n=1 Tax=Thermobacillus xylanilyticus TaxID=76633 RepID=A0ABM8V9F7_THEXY|nr:Protein of unknown function [Thermobacillus xylanilyticus]
MKERTDGALSALLARARRAVLSGSVRPRGRHGAVI